MYLVKRVMVPETRWHIVFLSEEAEWAGAFILCFLAVPLDLLSPTERAVRFIEGNTAAVVSEAKSPIQSRALNSVSFSLSLSLFFRPWGILVPPVRDRSQASCVGSTESWALDGQGSPLLSFWDSSFTHKPLVLLASAGNVAIDQKVWDRVGPGADS